MDEGCVPGQRIVHRHDQLAGRPRADRIVCGTHHHAVVALAERDELTEIAVVGHRHLAGRCGHDGGGRRRIASCPVSVREVVVGTEVLDVLGFHPCEVHRPEAAVGGPVGVDGVADLEERGHLELLVSTAVGSEGVERAPVVAVVVRHDESRPIRVPDPRLSPVLDRHHAHVLLAVRGDTRGRDDRDLLAQIGLQESLGLPGWTCVAGEGHAVGEVAIGAAQQGVGLPVPELPVEQRPPVERLGVAERGEDFSIAVVPHGAEVGAVDVVAAGGVVDGTRSGQARDHGRLTCGVGGSRRRGSHYRTDGHRRRSDCDDRRDDLPSRRHAHLPTTPAHCHGVTLSRPNGYLAP